MREEVPIRSGDRGQAQMPYSEVCMHLQVAGRVMAFEVTPGPCPMVQLLTADGRPLSFPITLGEAGIFSDRDGGLYYRSVRSEDA